MRSALVSTVLAAFYVASSQGLQCYEGFNISIGGVPFYHGTERECSGKSECFSQELKTKVFETKVKVFARYNGCISSAYSSLVTCEKLFGPDSKLDPTVLFDMIPNLDEKFDNLVDDFRQNVTDQFQEFFSNGNGTASFIAGCYTFLENIGFNMEKARPLESYLVKLFKLIFNPPRHYDYSNEYDYGYGQQYEATELHPEVQSMLQALKNLDTGDSEITENIYSFFNNFFIEDRINDFKGSMYAPLVEKLPGLVKFILPEAWKTDRWFDYAFEIIGELNQTFPKKSAVDVINTIKKVIKIPDEYNKILDPILNSVPDLIEKLFMGNTSYAVTWSLQRLKEESMTNDITKRLTSALEKFYAAVSSELSDDKVRMFTTWIPGLFYNLFESKKPEIDKVYAIISKGIEAMDFQNPSATLKTTKMSDFFIMLANKTNFGFYMRPPSVGPRPAPSKGPPSIEYELMGPPEATPSSMIYGYFPIMRRTKIRAMNNLLIINLSRVLYNLLPDVEGRLDAFFNTVIEVLDSWPALDTEKTIRNIIIDLGWEVPPEIEPMLNHLQKAFNESYPVNVNYFQIDKLRHEALKIIDEYAKKYQLSKMPGAIRGLFELVYRTVTEIPGYSLCDSVLSYSSYKEQDWDDYYHCISKFSDKMIEFMRLTAKESTNVTIDLLFAISDEMDYDNWTLFQNLIDTFPDFALYIHLMNTLDASDVKALTTDIINWYIASIPSLNVFSDLRSNETYPTPIPLTFTTFVKTLDPTIAKVTSKLHDVIKELWLLLAPDSCRSDACSDDLCNTRQKLIAKNPVTRDPKIRKLLHRPTKAPSTTTSGSGKINVTVSMMLLVFWAVKKLM